MMKECNPQQQLQKTEYNKNTGFALTKMSSMKFKQLVQYKKRSRTTNSAVKVNDSQPID